MPARPNRMFNSTSPITVFASAARAEATTFTSDIYKFDPNQARGALFQVNVTAGGGSNVDVTMTIQKFNSSTKVWDTALASAADIDGSEVRQLIVHPDIAAVSNLSAAANLGSKWRVTMAHDHAETITYSVLAFPLI